MKQVWTPGPRKESEEKEEGKLERSETNDPICLRLGLYIQEYMFLPRINDGETPS